ncbi:MAG: Outer rane porin protein 32 precursor [Herminiimonas sp.]|nr:Outer rane porin protein 32 precursor [Herminiimonas sp.]
MKKSVLTLAAVAALGSHATAFAQANVTVYGLIDMTLRTVNNATATGGRLVGFQTPWFSGSRLGFRGAEDLGGGNKAIFKLESEYVLGTGAMDTPGVLFNRDAWVGFDSSSLGRITFGRQNTLARDWAQTYGDAYGSEKLGLEEGGFTNTNNFKQLIYYAGSVTATRYDNGIVYKKAFDNGIVAGLGYQLGEVPGDTSRNTTKSVALGYNGSNYLVAGYYNQANVNNLTQRSYSIGGSYMFPLVRLNAGYFHFTADQAAALGERKDNAYTVSAKLTPGGAFDYELGYVSIKANNAAFNAAGTSTLNPFADASTATAAGTGKKSTVYGSVFYHLSKRTEVYAVADYMKLNDGYRVSGTNGFANQTEFGVGIRTRF